MDVIINESTSVIQIDGSVLALPTVYISTTTLTDHFATVIDMTGYVTAANPLHFSTNGTTLTGVTDAYIQQPFGYISLAAVSTNKWTIVNQDPFSVNASTIRALDAFAVNTATLSTTLISTMDISSDYLTLKSVVAQAGATGNPYVASMSLNVASNLQTGDMQASTIQSASATMLDISGSSARIVGDAFILGPISTQDITISSLDANSLTLLNLSTSADTDRIINLLGITAASTIASTVTASNLYLGSTSIVLGQGLVANRFQTPSTTIDIFNAFATYTSSIYAESIDGAMSTIQLGSTAILNPLGFMTLSSIQTNTVNANDVSGSNVSTNVINVSSISMNTSDPLPVILMAVTGDIITINSSWSISTNRLSTGSMNTSTLSVDNATTQAVIGDTVIATTLAPSLFTVGSRLALAGPNFYVPNVPLVTSQITAPTVQGEALIVGDLSGLQTLISNTLSIPSLLTADVSANAISTNLASTTTIYAKNMILGNKIPVKPSDPYIKVDSLTPVDSPPYQYASGSGTFTDPFVTFNTSPTIIYISLYNPSGTPLYLNVKIRHTNLPPPYSGRNGGTAAYINGNNIFSRLNIYGDVLVTYDQVDLNLANYPIQAPNPTTGDSTPYFVWDVQSSSVTTDELTFWISNNLNSVDVASAPVVDPTGGITMRKGILEWPSTIYGTSIKNSFNDIQTRSLFYTGSLKNVSDPALKRDLGEADLSACVTAAQTPLHTYEYRPAFASTFQIEDKRRLGILTTELSQTFPKSVTTEVILGVETQVASTDQVRYAHLGATKFLIAEVQRLRQKLLDS